jgi:hypothetical protein
MIIMTIVKVMPQFGASIINYAHRGIICTPIGIIRDAYITGNHLQTTLTTIVIYNHYLQSLYVYSPGQGSQIP